MATALLDNEGGLSIVDGSVSILNRWFRPGSSLCAELREWACTQRADGLGTVSLDKSRPFVAPSVDVVLVAYWRGERRMGDLIEFEEQIYDGADLRCLGLTAREAEVLALLVIGSDANAIAQRVGSRPGTVKKQIESSGYQVVGSTPAELDAHVRAEIPRWARVVKAAGVTAQ